MDPLAQWILLPEVSPIRSSPGLPWPVKHSERDQTGFVSGLSLIVDLTTSIAGKTFY